MKLRLNIWRRLRVFWQGYIDLTKQDLQSAMNTGKAN